MAETTISVAEDTLDRFKSLKSDLDENQKQVPDHTNESFLQALMDMWEAAEDDYYSDPLADEITEQLTAEIDSLAFDGAMSDDKADRMISSLNTLEERTGKIERQLEQLR